jgi:pyruvate formate lyase activating enzyme
MQWAPAAFYRAEGADLVCTLCPHECRLGDGEVGACQVRRRTAARLETATFATTVRHIDPVERKPFYHFRPGSRVLTLAAPGCTFACHYCQNYRISQFGRVPEIAWSAEEVDPVEIVESAAGQGLSIALSYSEPTLAAELVLALAASGRGRGVPILWKSNGFITPGAIKRLAPCLEAVNVDLKAADESRHRALTGAPLAPILEAIAAFVAMGIWVEVSTPVIPRVNGDADALARMAGVIASIDADIPWHLLRFTPEFRMRDLPPTSPALLAEAVAIGRDAGLRYVYVERALGPEGRSTYCPRCGLEVVSRDVWATRRIALVGGACPRCNAVIPGRW